MPVTHLKVQLECKMGSEGWSEIYWHSGTVPFDFVDGALALVNERKKSLVNVASIHHIRISAAQPGGRAYRQAVPNGGGALPATSLRDVRNTTINVDVYASSEAYRKMKFPGASDGMKGFTTDGLPINGLTPTIRMFLDHLVSQQYCIREVGVRANDPGLSVIETISVAGGVVTVLAHNSDYAEGQKIHILSCKGFKASQFNGVWTVGTVEGVVTQTITLQSPRLIDPNFFYVQSSGRIRDASPESFNFPLITHYSEVEEYSTRATGRPTDSPVGRR